MKGYILSPAARADLRDIWIFTAERWNAEQADSYLRGIETAFDALVAGDRSGRAIDDVRPGYFRLNVGSHVVCFRIVDDTLDVIRVLHGHMDIPARLDELP